MKQLLKYVKPKTKLHKNTNINTVKDKVNKFMNTFVDKIEKWKIFKSVHSLDKLGPQQENCFEVKKIMNELKIRAKDIFLSMLDVSKSIDPDEIHSKISNYLSSNDTFIHATRNCLRDV